ncbi:MAG: polyketide synthase dehydratase domain-containing protein, partial [Phycisphaerales bacterium]|nr:polyketide synthase dehydratase domain-containing protein [Phycisphaerales bacterium]
GRLGDFGIAPAHPLIDSVEMAGDTLVAHRALSLASDGWISDHAIDGKPVLPGVIGLEMMAAVAMMADPGHGYAGAEEVSYKSPVKLHGDAVTDVIVTATPVDGGVSCTLSSSRTARTGRVIETEHFSAKIVWSLTTPESLPPMGMPDHPVSAEEIYKRFFHGPGFQVLSSTSAATSDALMADGSVRHLTIAGGLLTSPLVLEAAFQAAGLHRMMVDGVMALPQAINQVVVLGSVRDDEPLKLTVRRDGDAYDVDVSNDEGPVLVLRGFQMVEAGPLPPGGTFEPPKGGWNPAVIARVKAGSSSGAKALLTEAEHAELTSRGTEKRQTDRILGRVAAKQAVSQLTGLDPASFEIFNRESGEPVVRTSDGSTVPHISISHRDGEAIAVATNTGRAGIDLEVVEARAPSFAETWFRLDERAMCQGDPRRESQVWAIKEAVLKVLGTGLRLDPREVEVLDVSDGHGSVRLWGEVATRHAALGGGELTVDVEDEQTLVIAVAWMAS